MTDTENTKNDIETPEEPETGLITKGKADWFTPILVGALFFMHQLVFALQSPDNWFGWVSVVAIPALWIWIIHSYGASAYREGALHQRFRDATEFLADLLGPNKPKA